MRLLPLLLVAVAATLPLALANDHDEFSEESGRHKYDYFGENSGESSEESLEDAYAEWFHQDYYGCLGLDRTATGAEIKRVYRQLSLRFHPDKADAAGKEEANRRFTEIGRAYNVLNSKKTRSAYDEFIASIPPQFRPRYGKVNIAVWKILLAFCAIVSVFQWVFMTRRADKIREFARSQPRYRNALNAARASGDLGPTEELPVDVLGASYPRLHELLICQMPLFPWYAGVWAYGAGRWWVRYGLLGRELTAEDAEGLRQAASGLAPAEYRRLREQEARTGARVQGLAMDPEDEWYPED
eukprot:TRINITY_DN1555_c0_g1_i2.p2 TRINITY_DN1555_c0_g1~~TRINITY_DN1555_c0_g1_i2.p2  ORF type:complete len:325 (-),score=92.01 TRINITY_DN1555_c0_g1_i2:50-946(-)